MPTLTFGMLYSFAPELVMPLSVRMLPFLFFTTCLIPIASISLMKLMGQLEDLHMMGRRERRTPFMMVTLYYVMTAYLFVVKMQVNQTVAVIFVASSVLLMLLTVITFWYKISIHSAGIGGLAGLFLALVFTSPSEPINILFTSSVIATGVVMSARLKVDAHTAGEVWTGALVGSSLFFFGLYYFG